MGRTIEIAAPAGPAEAYLTGDDAPGRPGMLLYVDAIGLRPRIEEMADRIASWGVVVLAPHVFYREGSAHELAPQNDLRVPGNREAFFAEAMPRVARLTPDLSGPDADAWLATLREHAAAPFGVVGYCMGARLAVRTAGDHPDDVVAAAGFHGGRLVTDAPDSPHRSLAGARAELVFGHADHDPSMTPADVAALGAALDGAGLTYVNEVFPAPHGFTMSDSAAYDEAATERHFAALRALVERTLLGGSAG